MYEGTEWRASGGTLAQVVITHHPPERGYKGETLEATEMRPVYGDHKGDLKAPPQALMRAIINTAISIR